MEGSESEAVFDAFNLNPQRFINEVLNSVDDTIDGAFDFCLQQAATVAGGSAEKSEELARGISSLRHSMQAVLDKRMSMWENYCLRHCFSVPDGFVLPKDKESSTSMLQELPDSELDVQLELLRAKLKQAGKESEELSKEINWLEKQCMISSRYESSIAEVQQLLEEHSVHQMYKDIWTAVSKLHGKLTETKGKKREEANQEMDGRICNLSVEKHGDEGLSAKLEDIEEVLSILRST